MEFLVLTALWRRPRLAEIVLQRYRAIEEEMRGEATFRFMAVGSEGDRSRHLAVKNGWRYVEAKNRPLGAKWNVGMTAAARFDPDAVVIVGSDDWLNANVFRFHKRAFEHGALMSGLLDIYFLYWKTMKAMRFGGYTHLRQGESLGLGRCLSREALEALNWKPWWPRLNRGLDYSMTKSLRKRLPELKKRTQVVQMADIDGCAIDVKTPVGICKFHSYVGSKTKEGKRNVEFVEPQALLTRHFPRGEADRLLRYVRSLRAGSTP